MTYALPERMRMKIIDGHVHMHYRRVSSDERIKEGLNKFKKLREKYVVKKVAGIFQPENTNVVRELEDKTIYPGIYVKDLKDIETLRNARDYFEFVKIHHWFASPDSEFLRDYLKKVIDESRELGFKKFQMHTEQIGKSFADMLREYIRNDKDMVFYLVHGVDSIEFGSEVVKEIKEMENNVLLGTFPSSYPLIYPNRSLQCAVKSGMENMISFDSDFILDTLEDNLDFYRSCIEYVTESIGYNRKIFEENSKIFFE